MPAATTPHPFKAKFSTHSPPPPKQRSERDREYLRPSEVESLIRAARKVGRHRIRDAAIILLMYRHGQRRSRVGCPQVVERRFIRWLYRDQKSQTRT